MLYIMIYIAGGYGPVPGLGGDDSRLPAVPDVEGCGGGYHDGGGIPGHLLLRHHRLDILLSVCRVQFPARPPLGHLRYVYSCTHVLMYSCTDVLMY